MSALRRSMLAALVLAAVTACGTTSAGTPPTRVQVETPAPPGPAEKTSPTPVQQFLAGAPMYVAHRGGDADWTEGTAFAYAQAAAWNRQLALEVSVWRTRDGVWVVSEDRTTGRVFGTDYSIPSVTWATLSTLRSQQGGRPMARLVQDVLDVYGRSRILFIDNKAGADVGPFLDLLDSYGGRARFVLKSYCESAATADAGHRRGYLTWGYYFPKNMASFDSTESRFSLLGLPYDAPAADFRTMIATGKKVIAHVVRTPDQARLALARGASGLMVAGVEEVVPR